MDRVSEFVDDNDNCDMRKFVLTMEEEGHIYMNRDRKKIESSMTTSTKRALGSILKGRPGFKHKWVDFKENYNKEKAGSKVRFTSLSLPLRFSLSGVHKTTDSPPLLELPGQSRSCS